MTRFIIFTCLTLLFLTNSYSQIKTTLSTKEIVNKRGYYDVDTVKISKVLPAIDRTKLINEDLEEQLLGVPYRFGKDIEVNYSSEKDGTWFTTKEGDRIWKLKINSKDALGLSIIFNKLILPLNAKLYIYNSSRTMAYGPVESRNIKNPNRFSTDIIKGNTIIIELFEPKELKNSSLVEIGKVIHVYKDVFPAFSGFGSSNSCEIDVNCYTGNIREESDAVAMVLLADQTRHCSGAMVTTACRDYTPNFLTAFHCVDIGNNGIPSETTAFDGNISTTESNNVGTWLFRFLYKSPTCNGPEPPSYTWITIPADQYLSGWHNTDFALIRLDEIPEPGSNIRYLGWTRTSTPATNTRAYHHPRGDVMKFSYDNDPPTNRNTTWTGTNGFKILGFPANHFWDVEFTGGGVEPGSSGSPLVDGNGRIVGQLYGGTECPNSTGIYGRFDESWDGGGSLNTRLSSWLTNTPSIVQTQRIRIPVISGPNILCSSNTNYTISYFPAGQSVSWQVTPSYLVANASGTGSTATLKAKTASSSGQATLTFTLTDGVECPNHATFSKTITVGQPISFTWQGPGPYGQLDVTVYGGSSPFKFYRNETLIYTSSSSSATIPFGCSGGTLKVEATTACGVSSSSQIIPSGCPSFFVVYPNPSTTEINVSPPETEKIDDSSQMIVDEKVFLTISNDQGEAIKSESFSTCDGKKINIQGLKKGTYYLLINSKSINETHRILVE